MPTILIKKSDTPGSVPGTANLTNLAGGAEVAVNTADRRMYSMNSSSAVVELGTNPSSLTCADASFTVARAGSATITNLTATSATIDNFTFTSATVTRLAATSAVITDLSATVGRIGSGTVTQLASTSATITTLTATSASVTNLTATSLVLSNLSIASANVTTLTSASATITNLLATTLTVSSGSTLNGGVVINEPGADADTRIEGDTDANLFFADASTDRIGIGTNAPGGKLEIVESSTSKSWSTNSATELTVERNGSCYFSIIAAASSSSRINFADSNSETVGYINYSHSDNNLTFRTNGSDKATLDSSGNLGIGTSSPTDTGGFGRVVDVQGSTGAQVVCRDSDDTTKFARLSFDGGTTNVASIGAEGTDTQVAFRAGGGEKMRLDASGNLGLGTNAPDAPLHIAKSSATSGVVINAQNSTTGSLIQLACPGVANVRFGAPNADAFVWQTFGSGSYPERMRLDASGNLGVANTSPGSYDADMRNLVVGTSGATGISIISGTSSNGTLAFGDGTGAANYRGYVQYNHTSDYLVFGTAAAERARITAAGELCINATATEGPARVTTVSGTSGTACYSARNSAGAGSTFFSFINNNDTALIGTITNNGNTATAYNTTSDARLKENIAPADDAGSVVDAIQIVKHDWKVGGHVRYGVIAQDLHEIAPEAVAVGDSDDVDELKRPWGVDYSKLVPMLVKEIQSLRARVAQLESK